MIEIKDLLRDVRTAHGYTETEVAEKIGVKQGSYSQWESGRRIPKPFFEKYQKKF